MKKILKAYQVELSDGSNYWITTKEEKKLFNFVLKLLKNKKLDFLKAIRIVCVKLKNNDELSFFTADEFNVTTGVKPYTKYIFQRNLSFLKEIKEIMDSLPESFKSDQKIKKIFQILENAQN